MMEESHSTRDRATSFSDTYEMYIIGDQIRTSMLSSFLIRDRKYHFRTYKHCFSGMEAIDWLLKCKHCASRESAISNMKILQNHGLFHHVCDDHVFKDEALFYRFRRDDSTLDDYQDLALFYKGKKLYRMIASKRKGITRDYQQNGQHYVKAFMGSAFVEWLINQNEVCTREEAINLGRKLLENNIIRHVTDDHHFRNEECLLYQFVLDFDRRRILSDVAKLTANRYTSDLAQKDRRCSAGSSFSSLESQEEHTSSVLKNRRVDSHPTKEQDYKHLSDSDSESSHNGCDVTSPRSVLLRQATAEELEAADTPYIKKNLRIVSDSVGYGFVVRGEGPSYVQTVDPMGPAAAAGLKVRQYVYSVNGVNVLRQDHKSVAKSVMLNDDTLNIVVFAQKRDAAFLS